MKNFTSYTRFTILTLLILLLLNSVGFSQGTDSRKKTGGGAQKNTLYVGILLNPVQTLISNEGSSSSSALSFSKGSSMNFALDAGYFFSSMIGISSGLSFSSYSTQLSLDTCSLKYSTIDSESEAYEMRIKGKSIVEDQKISFLSIPVCANFRYQLNEKFGFYVKAGLGFDIPLTKSYAGNGTFTYDGYYPAYPVLLQNLAAYGFPSNVNTNSSGSLEIKSFNLSVIASGGALYSVNESIQLVLGLYFNKSVSNISAYSSDANYKITSKANELNSIMGSCSGAKVQAFGLSLGVRYFLK